MSVGFTLGGMSMVMTFKRQYRSFRKRPAAVSASRFLLVAAMMYKSDLREVSFICKTPMKTRIVVMKNIMILHKFTTMH